MSELAVKTDSPCGVRVVTVEAELHESVEDILMMGEGESLQYFPMVLKGSKGGSKGG